MWDSVPVELSEFVYSEGFQKVKDFDAKARDFDPVKVARGDIVYCRHRWGEFFRDVHPRITEPYVLVSNYHDSEVRDHYPGLDDPTLLAWFANNVSLVHPKVRCIPRAIRLSQMAELGAVGAERHDKVHLLYSNFHVTTHHRRDVYERFLGDPLCFSRTYDKRDRMSYYRDMRQSYFALSPRGHGEDCWRTWEALALGVIPVLKKSFLDPLFDGLPVLLVDDWGDVTETHLRRVLDEFSQRNFESKKLRQTWWDAQIRAWK